MGTSFLNEGMAVLETDLVVSGKESERGNRQVISCKSVGRYCEGDRRERLECGSGRMREESLLWLHGSLMDAGNR